MIKKTLAAAVVAGALLFAGASAANAEEYPSEVTVTAAQSTLTVGGSTTITATFENTESGTATFSVSPTSGATLSSLVKAAAPGAVSKPINEAGVATANFTASAAGTYTVTATDGAATNTVTITVAAAGAGAGGGSTLPSTGGEIPAAALWVGAGALGLGGLAVVAAAARRRAQQR